MGNLDIKFSGKIGLRTVVYYLSTTVLAIILGITLVVTIRPGERSTDDKEVNEGNNSTKSLTEDTILDLIRNVFPENLVQSTFAVYKTVLVKPDNDSNATIYDYPMKSQYDDGMNILGIVTFSIVFGLIISHMKEDGEPLVKFFKSFNIAMMILTEIAIKLTPLAVLFLVLSQVLNAKDLNKLIGGVGWYFLTALVGLFIHGLIVLPLLFFIFTRKNPFPFLANMSAAMMTAFGTASSSATMPVTFTCLEERNKIDPRIVRFCIPVGSTINMDGTALYEAVAAIFIAQYRDVPLDFVQIIIISITATAASIGAAGIPQAGLVTMVIVLNAVGLPVADASLIIIVDWFLDRFRTAINVLGDAFGSGIVHYMSKKDLNLIPIADVNN